MDVGLLAEVRFRYVHGSIKFLLSMWTKYSGVLMDSEEEVRKEARDVLERLGYECDELRPVTTWCGRDRHDDQANIVVYVEFRGCREPFCVVETKAPEEGVDRPEWVNQARSYAFWVRGMVVPLTPFFAVYNGRRAALYETITGNRKKTGSSLRDVMPPLEEAGKVLERFLSGLSSAYGGEKE